MNHKNPQKGLSLFGELAGDFIPGVKNKRKSEYENARNGFLDEVSEALSAGESVTPQQFAARAASAGYDISDPAISQYIGLLGEIQNRQVGGAVPSRELVDPVRAMQERQIQGDGSVHGGQEPEGFSMPNTGDADMDYAQAHLQLAAQGLHKTDSGKQLLDVLKANKDLKAAEQKNQREQMAEIAKTVIGERAKNQNPVLQQLDANGKTTDVPMSAGTLSDWISGNGSVAMGWTQKAAEPVKKTEHTSTNYSYTKDLTPKQPSGGGDGAGAGGKSVSWQRVKELEQQENNLRNKAEFTMFDQQQAEALQNQKTAYLYVGDPLEQAGVPASRAVQLAQSAVGHVTADPRNNQSIWGSGGRLNMANLEAQRMVVQALQNGYTIADLMQKIKERTPGSSAVPGYEPPQWGQK